MIYISLIFVTFLFGVVLSRIKDLHNMINSHIQDSHTFLCEIQEIVQQIHALQMEHGKDYEHSWHEIVSTLEKIVDSINQSYDIIGPFMGFSTSASQHILICLRPFVHTSLNNAINHEDYETAQKCQQILDSLDSMINFKPQNNQ